MKTKEIKYALQAMIHPQKKWVQIDDLFNDEWTPSLIKNEMVDLHPNVEFRVVRTITETEVVY